MNIKKIFNSAKDYSVKLNYKKARELLSQIVEYSPSNHQALSEMRKNFIRDGKYVEGVRYFNELLKNDPNNTYAKKHLGIIYGKMGNSPQAIKILESVIEEYTNDIFLICELGLAYNKQGNIKGSNTCFERVLSNHSKYEAHRSQAELKRVEAELMKASKLAAATAMASGFAHQINNPLYGMQLSTQLLEAKIKSSNEKIDKEYCVNKITEVKQNIQRIKNLIEHLNRLVKYKNEKQEWIDVISIIKSAYELFSNQLESRGVAWVEDFKNDSFLVYGNETKLEQVFINLIANAREALLHTPSPAIEIQVKRHGNRVVVTFSDNGEGVPKEYQDRIFLSLFTTKPQGTGLGLWLCSTVIEQMNGNIDFKTSEGTGTSFMISLPLKRKNNE